MHFGSKARRILIAAGSLAGAVAILGLVAAAVVPSLVPPDELRRAAAQAISGGRDLPLPAGDEPALTLYPTPRLVLGKLEFALADNATLDTEHVVARLAFMPLLMGRVEISDITLVRPVLVLKDKAPIAPLAYAAMLRRPDLPALRVLQGAIAWRTSEGLTRELISGVNAALDRSSSGEGLAIAADFAWRDAPVEGRLAIDDVAAFLKGLPTPTVGSLASDGSRLRFNGTAAIGQTLLATGKVSAQSSSLRTFLAWVGAPAPTSGGFGRFDISAVVKADADGIAVGEVAADLDGNHMEGGLAMKLIDGRPVVQGTFDADSLDITPYGRAALTGPSGADWDRRPLNLSRLADLDIDLRLSSDKVRAEESLFTNVAASAVLRAGHLVLALGQANGWDGTLRASLTLSPSASAADPLGARVRLEAEGADISLEPALFDLAAIRRLEGKGNIQLAVDGAGRSVDAIAHNLEGTLTLSGRKGALMGIDAAQVLKRIESRPLSGSAHVSGGRTPYDTLECALSIDRGVASIKSFELTGNQVRLTLDGHIGIGARGFDLNGRAFLMPKGVTAGAAASAPAEAPPEASDTAIANALAPGAEPAAPPPGEAARAEASALFDLPFMVQGSWASPLLMPDVQSLIRRSDAAQPLLDTLEKVVPAARTAAGHVTKEAPAENPAANAPLPPSGVLSPAQVVPATSARPAADH